jgi:transglutaminase-like putative cysteine protease
MTLHRSPARWLPAAALVGLGLGALGPTSGLAADPPEAKVSEAQSPADRPSAPAVQADFGMRLKAEGGGVKNVIGTVTIPADWPDQQRVRVVKQEIPPGATVSYKLIDDVGRQMSVKIPWLPPGKEVRAVVTFEIQRLSAPPIAEAAGPLTSPEARGAGRKLAVHLAPSPKIESDDPQVRRAAQEAISRLVVTGGSSSSAASSDWEKVQAIHQWVHKNIAFTGDLENVQTCPQTLEIRHGVCAELNSLAVAMLRASRFPARLVRIPGHCYYEVYLVDGDGGGHWIAGDASARATIAFNDPPGGIILQKGDNVSVVDPATHRRVKGRFLAETVAGTPQTPGVRVHFQPISPASKASPSPSGRGPG